MQTHTTPGTRPAVTGGMRPSAEANAFPLLAASTYIMLNASRPQKELIIEALIGALDAADGDCDLEPDAEGERSCHDSRLDLRERFDVPTITLPIARVS